MPRFVHHDELRAWGPLGILGGPSGDPRRTLGDGPSPILGPQQGPNGSTLLGALLGSPRDPTSLGALMTPPQGPFQGPTPLGHSKCYTERKLKAEHNTTKTCT